MDNSSKETNLLSNFSLKEIGLHLTQFVNLFIKAPTQLKKCYSNRKEGKKLFFHYIFYSFLLILLNISDYKLALKLFLFQFAELILPFFIFIIPFTIFIRVFNKRLKPLHLFKFLTTLNIQIGFIISLICFIINWTENEFYYIILNNLFWAFWLICVITIPLFINLSKLQKAIWIIANYLSVNLCFFILGYCKPPDITNAIKKIAKTHISKDSSLRYLEGNTFYEEYDPITPDQEYSKFKIQTRNFGINDTLYLVRTKYINQNKIALIGTQYVSDTLGFILFTQIKESTKKLGYNLDSIKPIDTIEITTENLRINLFDSLRFDFNKKINNYKKYVNQLRNFATFESNRIYFNYLFCHLSSYEKSHIDWKDIDNITKNNLPFFTNCFYDSTCFVLIKLTNKEHLICKNQLLKIESEFENRHINSDRLMRIVLFPTRYLQSKLKI